MEINNDVLISNYIAVLGNADLQKRFNLTPTDLMVMASAVTIYLKKTTQDYLQRQNQDENQKNAYALFGDAAERTQICYDKFNLNLSFFL